MKTPEPQPVFTVRRRVLEPYDRMSEVLFGLIMALTFTGSLSVAEAGRDDIRTMFLGALGCNIAWGIIDGVFFLMGALADRARGLAAVRKLRGSADPRVDREALADLLPSSVVRFLEDRQVEAIREQVLRGPEPPRHASLRLDDWRGALGACGLVILSTFPVILPFLFMSDVHAAIRVSNTIAVSMLFVAGFVFGRLTGRRPVGMGVLMVMAGLVLVAITIALGG